MLRQLEQIPYIKDLVKRLRREKSLREACSYRDETPTEAHFIQMKKRVGVEGFRIIEAWMRHQALKNRATQPHTPSFIHGACVDGTDLPAWSSRGPHDTGRGLGDPDARVGRGKKGFLLGYQSLFLVDIEGFPLGHVEAPLNVNEKQLVEALLHKVLGESIEVELLAGDSQLESQALFDLFESLRMSHIIAWRKLKGRENPSDVLTVKDRIDVEGPEWKRGIYKRMRAMSESVNGRVKKRIAYSQFTWQGLENASIHVSLILSIVYAAVIAATLVGRPEHRYSIAYFA